ncbi:MAG: hypothetical protein C5B53_06535 [Candidatus Melainabacteria bacterium]|nr:MAG: hypothetical protein C5B53_06535 [Candidatus Melainabacteria bacterium]
MVREGWPLPVRRTIAPGQVLYCAAEALPIQDQPAPAPVAQLSPADRRRLQLELINQSANLDNDAIIALLPAQARQARTNTLRASIRRQVDALIECVRANPNADSNAIPFQNGMEPLSIDQITQIRNFINNNQNLQLNNLRDQIVQARLEHQLPAAFRNLLRERLRSEADSGTFGPLSRAIYNRVSTWLQQQIINTLQNLDDRLMAFPPGCPVEPPRSPISNRHVSDELYRAMIRRMRPGEPGTDINFRLPTLAGDSSPTPEQFNQLWRALNWFRDANELLSPIRQESQRQVISTLITRFNRPGWAREGYADVQQWQARAQAMINLESEMRACAELIVNIHNRFNTFPLDGLVGGNPPFPGQIEIQNGRITRIVPDLPATLHLLDPNNLSNENRIKIERCLQWLEHHGLRVNRQLARIFGEGANIYMLGDHATGDFAPADLAALRNRLPENVRNEFNLISHDFEVQPGPNNTYRVTPVTRYRNSPWYNYLNRIVDGTVYTERGATETLRAGELVLVNRSGRFELLAVENLASWKSSHTTWTNIRDGVTAAVDLSMIVLGGVEARAAWTAAGQLAARSGMGAARSYLARSLALRGGAWHMALGGTGFLTSAHFSDPAVHFLGISGRQLAQARHTAMFVDGGMMLTTGRGIGSIGTSRQLADQTQRVIAESFWLRNFERLGNLDLLHYTPIPYIRLSPSAGAAMRFSQARIGFAHLSTGHYLLPTLQVGMSFANVFGMVRDGRPPTGNALDPAGLTDRLPHTPFLAQYAEQLLTNANIDRGQITRLLGFITDNRPPQQAPERRRNVEQQLIDQFNRNGATERERLAVGTVLLLEAARNTADGAIPAHLGENATGLSSRTVRDFLAARYRESQDPEIRLLAAQGMMAVHDITAQEFATFCMAMAKNNNLPKEARAQAIIGVALCMNMAGIAEAELTNRVRNGRATVEDVTRYMVDNFGATHRDLQTCLESIASQNGGDRDLRALAAASAGAAGLGSFQQSITELQRLATSWNAARTRPAGSFATGQVGLWAQDLSLPVRFSPPDPARTAQNTRRIFIAAKALGMLSDQSFRPIWQLHNTAVAGHALAGPDAGLAGLLQPGSTPTRGRILTLGALNDALINCVNPADPEIAVQALTRLAQNFSTLQVPQQETLRSSVRQLLARLSLPNQGYQGSPDGAAAIDALTGLFGQPSIPMLGIDRALTARSAQEQLIRTQCREEAIRLLPTIFSTAPDNVRNIIIAQLTATLVPQGAMLATDTPELRQAAAIALGRLLEGRPVARSYLGNNLPVAADTIQNLLGQPSPLATFALDQNLVQSDRSPLARLELALQDTSPLVRLAAVEALLRVRPARVSHGRTLQQLCADLLITETDPAVLSALRRAEFLQRAPDPTSPDYQNDFQIARRDLLFSLNCRGPRSLSGVPAFLFDQRHNLTETFRLEPPGPRYAPYNVPYHTLRPAPLRTMALGNGPHALDALKSLAYIIISRGRPFELPTGQGLAVGHAVSIITDLCQQVNPANNLQKAQDVLWAIELCLSLDSRLSQPRRLSLLNSYMQLVQRMPPDAQLRQRAGVLAAIVLEREFVASRPANQDTVSNDLQLACIRHLNTHRTRAALPVLELIVRTNRNGPVLPAANTLLQQLRADANIVAPGTPGGPLRGTVAFDDAYEDLRRQLLDGTNGLFVQPGTIQFRPGRILDHVIPEVREAPGRTPEQRRLLLSFANGDWFRRPEHIALAPNLLYIWWEGSQYHPRVAQGRPATSTPQAGFRNLIALAERDAGPPSERRIQEQARQALAWIVAVNGDGLVHSLRDEFVGQAAQALRRITSRNLAGLTDVDSVLAAALVGQPFISQNRETRRDLLEALWNRRESNRGSISNPHVALILAGALRAEYQTMPRPDEPGFAASRQLQITLLGYLEDIGHRMCAPVVEAIATHHPVPEVRARATQTLTALHDNVLRVWDRARRPAAIDQTTLPPARAQALRQGLRGNGEHDGIVQAMFNAYLGRPILANDPRHDLYVEALSDPRSHVKLAAALVVLRSENTGFTQQERQAAMAVAADAALHGIHIGLRNSGRQILIDNLALGRNVVHPVSGTTIEIVKTADNVTLIESANGRITSALINGVIRTPQDGVTPPLLEFVFRDSNFTPETRLAAARSWFTADHNDMAPAAYNAFLVLLVELSNSTNQATRNAAIQIMSDALTSEREQMASVGHFNRGQRQLLLVRALAQLAHPVAREAIRRTALEHPHYHVRREASRAYSEFTLNSLSTSLARPLTNDSVVSFDPITSEGDWRRHWLTDNPASGLARIAQLYALIDRRSTAIPASTKDLVISALIPLVVDGNPEAFRQGSWIFRTLDPALAAAGIFHLNLRLGDELRAIQAGQAPTLQQRQKIERCLDLILAVCRSSPLTQESLARLQTTLLNVREHAHFAESPQIRQIVALMAASVSGPVLAINDARLSWLNNPHPDLQFPAARDCLLPSSTVSAAQRERAIQVLSHLFIHGTSQMRSQAQTILSGLTGADVNIALDALATVAPGLQGQNQQAQLLRCWTFSEELCENAQLPRESERFLRARLERRRADGSADEEELRGLQLRLFDAIAQNSYNPETLYSSTAVERYSVALLAMEQTHGRDSLEFARLELALAKAAYNRSLTHENVTTRRHAGELALRCARHAYQVLTLRLGPDAPETCDALYRLGIIEVSQLRHADGIEHLNEALRAYRRNPSHFGLGTGAWIVSQLAQAYIRNGDFNNAERISHQLLKMATGRVAAEHRMEVHAALANLAESYVRFARPPRYSSAETVWRRALELSRSSWGEANPTTLESMLMLAQCLAGQKGNRQAATDLMDRAMTLFGQQTDLFASDRSRIHRAHSRVLATLGRLREAVEASRRSRDLSPTTSPR